MKMLKSYVKQMIAIVSFCVLIICFWDMEELVESQQRYTQSKENWSVEMNGFDYVYEELPEEISFPGRDPITLKKTLSNIQDYTDCVAFYSSHQLVDVYINGKQVYKLYPPKGTTSKTPGNMWNFITVTSADEGKELVIVLERCYSSGKVEIPEFYFGARDSIMLWHIEENVVSFFVSVILLLIGIVLVISYIFINKTMVLRESVLWLGIFAIPLSVWSILECQIITFFTDQILLVSQSTFAVLKLAVVPVLQFIVVIYEIREDQVIKKLCIASMIEFWITSALQLLGVWDYRETFFVTHIIFVIAALYVLRVTVGRLFAKDNLSKENRRVVLTHTLCVGIVALAVLADVFCYYTTNPMDSAQFSRMGFLIYVVVLALELFHNSVQLIQAGKQVGSLKKEAETDALTQLSNRRAFENALKNMDQSRLEEYGIVVCDLNNLKKFNDIYGHSVGDHYIIVGSEKIQNLFGEYGTAYRIGGDEFCVLVRRMEEEQVQVLKEKLVQQLHEAGGTKFAFKMEAAVGFARFNRLLDASFEDTMKRADANMYESKKAMKAKIL